MRYRTSLVEESVGPLHFKLQCIADFEDAVDAMYRDLETQGRSQLLEELCPYFGVLWPSARRLARWIWEQGEAQFAGKKVLELGCGIALPSLVAARLRSEVTATDNHPDVPFFLAQNLQLNRPSRVAYQHLDWSRHRLSDSQQFDWILASDVLYEAPQAASLVAFLKNHLGKNGTAIVFDPDRSYWERMLEIAKRAGLLAETKNLVPEDDRDPKNGLLITIKKR